MHKVIRSPLLLAVAQSKCGAAAKVNAGVQSARDKIFSQFSSPRCGEKGTAHAACMDQSQQCSDAWSGRQGETKAMTSSESRNETARDRAVRYAVMCQDLGRHRGMFIQNG